MSRCWPAVRVILLALFVVAAAPSVAPAAEGGAASELFAPRLDLMIWTIVVFGVLLFVLKKFAWGPMLQGLQGREERIRGALDEAQTARDEAQKLRDDLQAERDRSLREIDRDFEQKKQELWNQTAQLATLISAKALGRSINEADHRHLVDEALAEIRDTSAV